ncbi:hypothetical protein [Methylomonas koyamae]|jgi:gas vesicle protein|uniref:Dynamin family protein n=1 Tax=Methylomonas koyamae TaxID=702114 RepID=A0AA91DCF6_9GAMM|nr:hypothetical protein [Methylomonas koyamae]OAI26191.1 hypothetical protein A1356_11880 [Methylomonas koyamae]
MSDLVELDSPFEQTTGIAPLENGDDSVSLQHLSIIKVTVPDLNRLVNRQLPALVQKITLFESLKLNVHRIDGLIIGTGKADFTQGNTVYSLNYKDKTFQLIDVPGIEGDESKYEEMVRKAVAKAHLVFYVNGTNKKPEQGTAKKIRGYLRHGTQVCPLVNIRGNADFYEFEEDRVSLQNHRSSASALEQTVGVLHDVLGKDVLLPGHCVQGLLGFSSLAFHLGTGKTTIHPSRDNDLVFQQRNYLKYFSSPQEMYEFSEIKQVARILHNKLDTFHEDIIESNKTKISELLSGNIAELEQTLIDYQEFIKLIKPEFDACRESIKQARLSFQRLVESGRKNLWNNFFTSLCEESDDIVAKHFGDSDRISSAIERAYKSKQKELCSQLEDNFNKNLNTMLESIETAMKRLIEDVQRLEFQQRFVTEGFSKGEFFRSTKVDMGFGMKDFGKMALGIGSYIVTGAGIGSTIPVIGTLIGAAVGAVVGILMTLLSVFSSREKRIRKAQAKVQESIDDVRRKVMNELKNDVQSVIEPVRKIVESKAMTQVDDLYNNMAKPIDIMQQQISLMKNMKNILENMPYGTVQAI